MNNATKLFLLLAALLTFLTTPVLAQTSGSISGEVKDEKQAIITNATVTVRNVKTNETRTTTTDGDGRYRFTGMPVGDYEVTVESTGFREIRAVGNHACAEPARRQSMSRMKPGGVTEVVNVVENASMLNTTNCRSRHTLRQATSCRNCRSPPIGTFTTSRFQRRGVSQLQSNQAGFTNGINYSSNGGRFVRTTS